MNCAGGRGGNCTPSPIPFACMSVVLCTACEFVFCFFFCHCCINSIDIVMRSTNITKIKSNFSILLLDVRSALELSQIEVKDIHQFLTGLFQCDGIPRSDLMGIFEAVSTKNLWNYLHYSPLGNLINRFIPDKAGLITTYKKQLSGFCVTAKLIDYIRKEKDFKEKEDSTDNPNQLPLQDYTKEHYQKLRVVLNIERNIFELSLQYVQDIWAYLAEEFHLPYLTAIIDKILEGSLDIIWRIPSYIGNMIAQSAHKCSSFFHQHHVILISLDNSILYDARLPMRVSSLSVHVYILVIN